MLTSYLQQTQRLLHDPNAALYPTADLTDYINEARRQLAIESQSIRSVITSNLAANSRSLDLSSLTGTALLSPVNARSIFAQSAQGNNFLVYRPWDWFFQYSYFSGATGQPLRYSLLTNTTGGTIFVDPQPTITTVLNLEIVWYPANLIDDSTPEDIAVPWQDCVKFYAAYLAYANSQRTADADSMFGKFEMYMARARKMTMPTRLPGNADVDWSQQAPQGGGAGGKST